MDAESLAKTIGTVSDIIRGERGWDGQTRDLLLKECQVLFGAEVCAVFLNHSGWLKLESHIGYAVPVAGKHTDYEITAPPGPYDGITGYVASVGEAVKIDCPGDLPRVPGYNKNPDRFRLWHADRPFRCLLAVPMKVAGETIGVLKIDNKTAADGTPLIFDDLDLAVAKSLANLFAVAVKFQDLRGLPYDRLFATTTMWLKRFDRRNLYQNMVELCASLFAADICALFVRKGSTVALVAGRFSEGDIMSTTALKPATDPSYQIGVPYDGITGKIATTKESVHYSSFGDIKADPSHRGKWDTLVWDDSRSAVFGCMIGVPILDTTGELIGVLKVERLRGKPLFAEQDVARLTHAAAGFAAHVATLIAEGDPLSPVGEFEYRIIRARKESFERKAVGDIVVKHRLTSICHSDIYYFKHDKDPKKLNERLPMALGHETVGEIIQTVPGARHRDGEKVSTGDQVFVIPLQPCMTCHVCTKHYGENYCPSARFMASNAPGSLRTSYPYEAALTLKVPSYVQQEEAVFTEPMSNVINMLTELGFVPGANRVELDMRPYDEYDFDYLNIEGAGFTNVFNTVTSAVPNPRTLFICRNHATIDAGRRKISQQSLMTKGLGVLGHDAIAERPALHRTIDAPKVLILGTGVSAYLLALTLREVYGVPRRSMVVTGRTTDKLLMFKEMVADRIRVADLTAKQVAEQLSISGEAPGPFDIVFECVGGEAVTSNLDLAFKVLKHDGVCAMFGLTDDPVEIDFGTLIRKRIFIKGSYRASLNAYGESLRCIGESEIVRLMLRRIIDSQTEVRGKAGFHDIEDAQHLEEFFIRAEKSPHLGRMMIRHLRF